MQPTTDISPTGPAAFGVIAERFRRAGQPEKAVGYLRQAGRQAVGLYAYGDAVQNLNSALALVPAGVRALAAAGHEVIVEQSAGVGSGIADAEYSAAGAKILPTADDVFARAEMIVKVKEPVGPEGRAQLGVQNLECHPPVVA